MTSTSKLLGAVIAGTLALGCSISSSPVIARVESIQITPNRISLVPLQAANLNVMVITSRGVDSSGAAAVLQWSATGGTIANGGDRKSTRLNSSHVKISYAVFCLKKKIKSTEHDVY